MSLFLRVATGLATVATMAIVALFAPLASAASQGAASDTIVRIAGAPRYTGIARLVEEVSIGTLDGAEEYVFGDIAEIAIGPDGAMYVFDRQVPALRKYDARGRYVRTLGREGQGPGEYLKGGGLAVHPDGRVMLWDTGTWRINVYSPAGEPVGSWSTPSGASGSVSLSTSRALMIDSAGVVWYRRTNFDRQNAGASQSEWVRFDRSGALLDTVPEPRFSVEPTSLTATNGRATSRTGVPFEPRPLTALSPRGFFVTGYPQRYAFELLTPPAGARRPWRAGDPVVSIRRPDAKAAAVSRAERDTARRTVEERMRGVDPAWSWNGPPIPETQPFYTRLVPALDGRIWLSLVASPLPQLGSMSSSMGGGAGGGRGAPPPPRVASPPPLSTTPIPYDVFESNGVYLGRVEIPPRVSLAALRGDQVWGVAYGDDDVPFVKRYGIVWP